MDRSEVSICVLVSTQEEEDLFGQCLSDIEAAGKNVSIFSDPDECIEALIASRNCTYILILGPGRSNLVDIFSTFPYVICMYLGQIHDFKDATRVRYIYSNLEQLLIKLKRDIKIMANIDLNFTISRNAEEHICQKSTKDVQDDIVEFKWTRKILNCILKAPRPNRDIYADMLKECREIYKNNPAICQEVDLFDKEYDRNTAIWWYTKNSFVYRQINAAFRSDDIVIVWKFRFVIQDIYQQLARLHAEQNTSSNSK